MKVVEIGSIGAAHNDDSLPESGIVIAATKYELQKMPMLIYENAVIVGTQALRNIPDIDERTSLDEWNGIAKQCVSLVQELKRRAKYGT